jgi:ABC-type multidrug transport system fused ATPase/permease subunit
MKNPYLSLLGTAWRYARKERGRYLLVYALFGCSNLMFALYPVLYGWFIDTIQRDQSSVLRTAWRYGACYLLLKAIEWAFHAPARLMERQLAFNLSRNFLNERCHQALHLPLKWHEDHHSGATINRIRKAYESLRNFFDGGYLYVHALLKLVFSVTAMLYFSPVFGGVGVLVGLLTVVMILKFDRPLIASQESFNEREHELSATLFDSLSNIRSVVTLRLEQSIELGLRGKLAALWPPFRRSALLNESKWFSAEICVALIYAVIAVGYVCQHWTRGQALFVGGLVTLLAYVEQFTSVFHDVAWQYTQVVAYNTDVQTACSIEDQFARQHRPDEPADLPADWQEIRVANLNFSHRETYQKGRAQSLHGISLTLPRGGRVALVGPSGSGKSTVLALLRGLYDPEPGSAVTVDGQERTLGSLAAASTLFPQEPEIFENTIAYNITLGLPFDPASVDAVCEQACFTETILDLPNGLDSNIQEKGVNLSGGQKQRLALARGMLAAQQSALVLLDEPTSSIDSKTEARIYENVFAAFRDSCVVSAMHRLHLLREFDRIYVLAEGRLVAEGTLEELLVTSPLFQELWRHQQIGVMG